MQPELQFQERNAVFSSWFQRRAGLLLSHLFLPLLFLIATEKTKWNRKKNKTKKVPSPWPLQALCLFLHVQHSTDNKLWDGRKNLLPCQVSAFIFSAEQRRKRHRSPGLTDLHSSLCFSHHTASAVLSAIEALALLWRKTLLDWE